MNLLAVTFDRPATALHRLVVGPFATLGARRPIGAGHLGLQVEAHSTTLAANEETLEIGLLLRSAKTLCPSQL